MIARATQTINSGHGTFVRRDPLTNVPEPVIASWVEAGIAAYDPEPAPAAVEPKDLLAGEDLADLLARELKAIAEGLGLHLKGNASRAILIDAVVTERARLHEELLAANAASGTTTCEACGWCDAGLFVDGTCPKCGSTGPFAFAPATEDGADA